jgi:hypothetical protein
MLRLPKPRSANIRIASWREKAKLYLSFNLLEDIGKILVDRTNRERTKGVACSRLRLFVRRLESCDDNLIEKLLRTNATKNQTP